MLVGTKFGKASWAGTGRQYSSNKVRTGSFRQGHGTGRNREACEFSDLGKRLLKGWRQTSVARYRQGQLQA